MLIDDNMRALTHRTYMHVCIGIEGNARFTYLEGCFHLLTPYMQGTTAADFQDAAALEATQLRSSSSSSDDGRHDAEHDNWASIALSMGLSANYPGVTLSTGMEDYYDSSFYFHAGIFQLP